MCGSRWADSNPTSQIIVVLTQGAYQVWATDFKIIDPTESVGILIKVSTAGSSDNLERVFANHPALGEPGGLSRTDRLIILDMERRIASYTYWQILGVDGTTSLADLKKAYFRASKQFHPDRYFGKQIGSFAPRLQRIFEAIKRAHTHLSQPPLRAAYARLSPPPGASPLRPPTAKEPPVLLPPAPASTSYRSEAGLGAYRQQAGDDYQGAQELQQAELATRYAFNGGNLTQARIWAERAVSLSPKRLDLRVLAAQVCERVGDIGAALGHLELAASLDNADVNVKNLLVRLSNGGQRP